MNDFEERGLDISIVVDEYGHVMGLVTMDDLLEEIVGDVFDKSKKSDSFIKMINDNEFIFDGRTPISIVEEYIDLGITRKTFDTVAGLILQRTGRIPRKGEVIRIHKAKIIIEESSPKTIKKVRIKRR